MVYILSPYGFIHVHDVLVPSCDRITIQIRGGSIRESSSIFRLQSRNIVLLQCNGRLLRASLSTSLVYRPFITCIMLERKINIKVLKLHVFIRFKLNLTRATQSTNPVTNFLSYNQHGIFIISSASFIARRCRKLSYLRNVKKTFFKYVESANLCLKPVLKSKG